MTKSFKTNNLITIIITVDKNPFFMDALTKKDEKGGKYMMERFDTTLVTIVITIDKNTSSFIY